MDPTARLATLHATFLLTHCTTPLSHTYFRARTEDCSICVTDAVKATLKIKSCTHIFHRDCIRDWFKTKARDVNADQGESVSCPMCRAAVGPAAATTVVVGGKGRRNRGGDWDVSCSTKIYVVVLGLLGAEMVARRFRRW